MKFIEIEPTTKRKKMVDVEFSIYLSSNDVSDRGSSGELTFRLDEDGTLDTISRRECRKGAVVHQSQFGSYRSEFSR